MARRSRLTGSTRQAACSAVRWRPSTPTMPANPTSGCRQRSAWSSREHVPVVIGALCTPVTHAIMPVLQEARVPLIIATSAGQDFVDASGAGGDPYAFKTIPSETDIARGLFHWAQHPAREIRRDCRRSRRLSGSQWRGVRESGAGGWHDDHRSGGSQARRDRLPRTPGQAEIAGARLPGNIMLARRLHRSSTPTSNQAGRCRSPDARTRPLPWRTSRRSSVRPADLPE